MLSLALRPGGSIVLASAIWLLAAAAPDPKAAFVPPSNETPDRAGRQMLVSPAFPVDWPKRPNRSAVVRHAFGMRLKSGVADGTEMTAQDASGGTGGAIAQGRHEESRANLVIAKRFSCIASTRVGGARS